MTKSNIMDSAYEYAEKRLQRAFGNKTLNNNTIKENKMATRKYVGLVYEDEDKQWRWKLMAPNGNNVANAGESYKNKAQAKKMLMKVAGLANSDTPFELLVEVKT